MLPITRVSHAFSGQLKLVEVISIRLYLFAIQNAFIVKDEDGDTNIDKKNLYLSHSLSYKSHAIAVTFAPIYS